VPDPSFTSASTAAPQQFEPRWDWGTTRRILLVRLRSIGDAVLTTPTITALRRFLPDAQIDILLEDWVAPVLEGFPGLDNIITFSPGNIFGRFKTIRKLRRNNYDVIYNLHGGTTSTFLTWLAGAKHKVGFGHYRYGFLYDHLSIPALDFWQSADLHSAEQQLALIGWTGVPVSDRPRTSLTVSAAADKTIAEKLKNAGVTEGAPLALFHPAAAFSSKQWAAEKFVRVAEYLSAKGFALVAVAAADEESVLRALREAANAGISTFSDLSLPEITALAARSSLFVGNDSGIAHIAAAVDTKCVVIFGSSNIVHWRPYTGAPNEVVSAEGKIENVTVEAVIAAIEKILNA
jgi:predicted lipopolysaccharide heptosyltransferase III